MGGKNIKNLLIRLINLAVLLPGLLLIYHIHNNDREFFAFGDNIFFRLGTGLMLAHLTCSASSKALVFGGKFYGWLTVASFIALMLFLINIIPETMAISWPQKTVTDTLKTNYVPHFLLFLAAWLICDVFTFSYAYPNPDNKK